MAAGSAKPPRLEVFWASQALQDRAYWQRRDKRILTRVDKLIADILEHPLSGIGKPEPLRYEWSGYWSRRINAEHRLVYRIEGGALFIAQCRFHYD